MGPFPNAKKMPRLSIGDDMIDGWIDGLVSTVERNSNVTATGGIQARVDQNGIALSLVGSGNFRIAKTGGSGIPAATSTTMGKGTVTVYDTDPATGGLASQAVTDDGYNLSTTAVGANKMVMQARLGVLWVTFWEDC